MSKKLSIIIPAFNVEKTIARAVESIITCSSNDIEIIIIDDGSTDQTKQIINDINDPRILFVSQEHSGVAIARNNGINKATGKYLTFLDSDDYYYPGAIETILQYIDNDDFDMLGFGFYKERFKNGKLFQTVANSISSTLRFDIEDASEYFQYIFESSHILFQTAWNKVFKRDIFEKYNICYTENMVCYENLTMIFEYLKYAKKIMYIKDILYCYCGNLDRASEAIHKRKKLDLTSDVSKCYKKFIELCEKYDYPDSYRRNMNYAFLKDFTYCSKKYFVKLDDYTKKQQKEAFNNFLIDKGFQMLKNDYLSEMRFYNVLFKLADLKLTNIAYFLYKEKIIKNND